MDKKKIETPVSLYKREILRMMHGFWKSENKVMWCKLYTFIKYCTADEKGE